jgi:hypothetical protein
LALERDLVRKNIKTIAIVIREVRRIKVVGSMPLESQIER